MNWKLRYGVSETGSDNSLTKLRIHNLPPTHHLTNNPPPAFGYLPFRPISVPDDLLRLVWLFQKIYLLITQFDIHRTFRAVKGDPE